MKLLTYYENAASLSSHPPNDLSKRFQAVLSSSGFEIVGEIGQIARILGVVVRYFNDKKIE